MRQKVTPVSPGNPGVRAYRHQSLTQDSLLAAQNLFGRLVAERIHNMKGLKGSVAIVASIAVLSVTGSALASKGNGGNGQGNDRPGRGNEKDQPVAVPESGSTLLLLGIGLASVEAYRRWASRSPKEA